MNEGWDCSPHKAIRIKLSDLRRTISERHLHDLRFDSRPQHLPSAINQIRNQLSSVRWLRRGYQSFCQDMRLFAAGLQGPLDEALSICRDYELKLETLQSRVEAACSTAGDQDGVEESLAETIRSELNELCGSILERIADLRVELANHESAMASGSTMPDNVEPTAD